MIVNDEQRRVMEFIAFVNRGGYRPIGREINEWRLRPQPKQSCKGELLAAEIPAEPARRVRISRSSLPDSVWNRGAFPGLNVFMESLAKQFAGFNAAQLAGIRALQSAELANTLALYGGVYETVPGKPGKPAVYGPDKPPEKFLAHLRRLSWIERDARGGYGITLLGHALLRAQASSGSEGDDSSVMVLAAYDELAYGRVIGVIAECGDAFIMDAYLGSEELISILRHTNATRFLVGDKLSKNRLTELALLVELTPPGPSGVSRELRQGAFHDRWVVGDQKLYGLGASINGVGGKSTTTLVEMPDAAARFIRVAAEDLWIEAKVVAATRRVADDSDGGRKLVRKEADRFLHDGCDVRHKTVRAAENCANRS